MGKRYYWLKLPDDFFRQKPIKKLRRIAGGDTYTIIYLKMLLVSLKNEGKEATDEMVRFAERVIELESNYSVDNVKEAFLSALKTYYRTAKDNEEIRYTVVSALLSNTAGVIDFSGLKINSGTDNIAVAADYYPVTTLSDLDFTEG